MRSKEDTLKECGTEVEFGNSSVEPKVKRAMDEYAIYVLEWFFSQQYHPGSVDVDARDSAEKTYKNYLEILESKNNESKA